MKKVFVTSIFALAIVSGAGLTAAFADDTMSMKQEMMKADTNKDGMISVDEFISCKKEMFEKMDKDSDGKLNMAEQKMMMEKMHATMMKKDNGMMHDDKMMMHK